MKEAIGGTWIFTIVITLITFFTCFVSISTNYARTYKIKDEIITIITNKKGINGNAITTINDRLSEIGYGSSGTCPTNEWYGFSKNRNDRLASYYDEISYCIKINEICCTAANGVSSCPSGHTDSSYYSVMVFFQLDIPLAGELFKLNVEGETPVINLPRDKFTGVSAC